MTFSCPIVGSGGRRNISDDRPAVVVVIWIGTNGALQRVRLPSFGSQLDQIVAQVGPARVVLVTPIADLSAPTAYVAYATAVRRAAPAHDTALVDLEGRIARTDVLARRISSVGCRGGPGWTPDRGAHPASRQP